MRLFIACMTLPTLQIHCTWGPGSTKKPLKHPIPWTSQRRSFLVFVPYMPKTHSWPTLMCSPICRSHRGLTGLSRWSKSKQLCQTGRRFDKLTILTKIHQPVNVPGVVQAVGGEIIPAPLSPGREKHHLGLQQMGSPFTSIPMTQSMLETLFDLLEGIWIFVAIWSTHMFASNAVFAFQSQSPSSRC